MLTMLEKTAVATVTATLPTVTYDLENRQITATVIVTAGESGQFHHAVPHICIPGPGPAGRPWTVLWTLAPAEGLSAVFGTRGVVLPPHSSPSNRPPAALPPDLRVVHGLAKGSEARIEFINDVVSANFFNYDLDVCINNSHSVKAQMIDPTIAVVPEPMT